jgi:NADH-quinone oxidoreductase subunit B
MGGIDTLDALVLPLPGVGLTLHVLDLGLACCAVELSAVWTSGVAAAAADDAGPANAPAVEDPTAGSALRPVLVIAGTLTNVELPALLAHHARMPPGTAVVAFGACTISGGPYWDSYSVTNGVDQVLPVDLVVPGCPPGPEALVAALRRLVTDDRLASSSAVADGASAP